MSSKMKVAIDVSAIPQNLTGAGYYVREIVRVLNSRQEIDLTLISKRSDKSRFEELAPNARIIPTVPDSKAKRILFQIKDLGKLVDSLNVDVFHGPHYQIPPNMRTPSVVTIHDLTLLSHKEVHTFVKKQFFSRTIPHSIKNCESIITVSESTKDDLFSIFGTQENVYVAQLGVDTNRFNSTKAKGDKERLAKRGISGDYIAFLGLLEPRKSIPTLVRSFAIIADEFPNLRLVLAGDKGWDTKEITTAITESKVATRIVLPGRLADDEVAPFLRNALVFVYPSKYEGFGMPVLESMACGTPTITTNSSSLKEVAGKGALLANVDDEENLAELIKSLLEHDLLRSQMSIKALNRSAEFSWEKCCDVHIKAYENAASKES